MTELSATAIAASGLRAQGVRLRHISENIANADTPGYRRKLVSFEPGRNFGRETGEVRAGRMRHDRAELPQVYDPGHPMAGEDGYYLGSNVNLIVEIADAREASRSYEANLKMFEQSRQMSASLLDLIRR
ncbi:flagellar basal body rod protein FlgC [Paracoccus chinensis]|uniref:Flagellar basal-body rod protein FlgC n=1 Tax=Paracoccus chinensis TaxID=525640 RepID=A0A1G9HXN1_9RHOB|nr:flagellar basal body rod protein FlgC [Paracoccus chinensis]SDL17721.1 flagellar basal-body rod protein FlgC [Paracoccus chinensis]